MADVKISALTAASTPLTGAEVLPIVQSSVTTKVAVSNLTAGLSGTASININGTVGATTPTTGAFTSGTFSSTLGVTGVATLGNGAILGTPASGTVTNLTGTASININGTVGATTATTGAFTSGTFSTTLGVTGTSLTLGGDTVAAPILTINGTAASSKQLKFSSAGTEKWNLYMAATTHVLTLASTSVGPNVLEISQTTGAVTIPGTLGVTGNATFDTDVLFVDATNNFVGIGTTTSLLGTGRALHVVSALNSAAMFKTTAGVAAEVIDCWNTATTGDNVFSRFATEGSYTERGAISYNRAGGLTVYGTTSDYRLKEKIIDLPNALETVSKLKPRQFDWKETGNTTTGFIAHELAEICPHAVTGEKDATKTQEYEISPAVPATFDEKGKELAPAIKVVMGEREVPAYQGVDTSFLIATLTAAIQELSAKVAALEAK